MGGFGEMWDIQVMSETVTGTCIGSLGIMPMNSSPSNNKQQIRRHSSNAGPLQVAVAGHSGGAAALDSCGESGVVGVGKHGLRVEEVNGARLRQNQTG